MKSTSILNVNFEFFISVIDICQKMTHTLWKFRVNPLFSIFTIIEKAYFALPLTDSGNKSFRHLFFEVFNQNLNHRHLPIPDLYNRFLVKEESTNP